MTTEFVHSFKSEYLCIAPRGRDKSEEGGVFFWRRGWPVNPIHAFGTINWAFGGEG